MSFVKESHFAHLPHVVAEQFIAKRLLLKGKLMKYQLDAFFLSDAELRGRGRIRAYVESFNFENFSPKQRRTGGKYMSFCDIFQVCISSNCK